MNWRTRIAYYRGRREADGTVSVVTGVLSHLAPAERPLEPHLELVNHSPGGFEWGYSGSGPAQLAFAILFHHLEGDELARNPVLYQAFKAEVVSGWRGDGFLLVAEDLDRWLSTQPAIQARIRPVSGR